MTKRILPLALAVATLTTLAGVASAAPVGLTLNASSATLSLLAITNNSGQQNAVATQIGVVLQDASYNPGSGAMNGVYITVTNNGAIASSVTDFYVQDPADLLAPPPFILEASGNSWGTPANPGDLPGGTGIFEGNSLLSADSNAPASQNGIQPGETLGVFFKYNSSNFASVLSQFQAYNLSDSAGMALGFHIQAIGTSGNSDGFVTYAPPVVPIPAAAWTGLSALAGLGLVGKLRKKLRRD